MGRMYSAVFDNIAQSAAGDIIEIASAAAKVVIIHSIFYGQEDDYGDASADGGRLTLQRATTSGSGGTVVTGLPLDPGDAAGSATVERNNSTPAATLTLLVGETFNWQAGWFYKPTPEERVVLGGADIVVLRLEDTPAVSHNTSLTLIYEEIG